MTCLIPRQIACARLFICRGDKLAKLHTCARLPITPPFILRLEERIHSRSGEMLGRACRWRRPRTPTALLVGAGVPRSPIDQPAWKAPHYGAYQPGHRVRRCRGGLSGARGHANCNPARMLVTCWIGQVHVVPRLSSVTTHLQPSSYSSSDGGGGLPGNCMGSGTK